MGKWLGALLRRGQRRTEKPEPQVEGGHEPKDDARPASHDRPEETCLPSGQDPVAAMGGVRPNTPEAEGSGPREERPAAAPSVESLVEKLLRDSRTENRIAAAEALGRRGPAAGDAILPLLQSLAAENAGMRQAALNALEAIDAGWRSHPAVQEVVPFWATALRRGALEVNNYLTRQLCAIGAPAVPGLAQAIAGAGDVAANVFVLRALAQMGPNAAQALPEMIRSLESDYSHSRIAAAEALERIGPAAVEAIPALKASLTHWNPEVRRAVAQCLARLEPAVQAPKQAPSSSPHEAVPPAPRCTVPETPRRAAAPRQAAALSFHPPGTRIAGLFEVVGQPLMGGMGIVYMCIDYDQDRPVALKTFQPRFLPNRAARDRFLREGAAWVALGAHPNIVHCYGVAHLGDATEVYLVLELVAKEQERADASLRSWLVPGQPLPVEQALLFALQIARGMRHATEKIPGLVHRDLKPENVLVGADRLLQGGVNRLRVTDFGLVTVLQEVGTGAGELAETSELSVERTRLTHGVVGTPLYMAPEQWRGEAVTAATDIYALGCILHEMLTGRRAVTGQTVEALRRAHCAGETHRLPEGLPGALNALVTRCLTPPPEERYGNWQAMEAALAAAYQEVVGGQVPSVELAAADGRAERVRRGWSYRSLARAYEEIGRLETAVGFLEQAMAVGEAEGEQPLVASALDNLGVVHLALGDARRALACHEKALACARAVGDHQGEGAALANVANAYVQLGELRRAVGYCEQALEIAREGGHRQGETAALISLGSAYHHMGDLRRSIWCHERALAIAREVGNRRGESAILGNLGTAYAAVGHIGRAIEHYQQALAIKREIGDRRGEAVCLNNLGGGYRDLGDARRAMDHFQQALDASREVGDRHGEGMVLNNIGSVYSNMGDMHRAIGHHEQALAILREFGDRRNEGDCLTNMGFIYMSLRDTRRAMECCEQALIIDREIGDIRGLALDSFNMANLLAQQGRFSEALAHAEESARILEQVGHAEKAMGARQLVAELRAELRR